MQPTKSTILLIEDSETNSLLVRSLFADNHDYTILVANKAKQAFQILKKETPDLILLDLMLPEIDGFQILELLKAEEQTKNIPVIVVSARDKREDIKRAKELGAVDYIMKPIGLNRLYERVNEYLTKK